MNQLIGTDIEAVEAHTYRSVENPLNGHDIRAVMSDRQVFSEKIATYMCHLSFPNLLGGAKEVLHIGGTTVGLGYNDKELNMPSAEIYIYGTEKSINVTKSILERLSNTHLERGQ